MKKSLFIITLCFIQGACAGTNPVTGSNQAWPGSQQIAAEISIQYELLEVTTEIETATARNEVAAN